MNIQKLYFLACTLTSFNAFAAPNALNPAPAVNMAPVLASAPGQTAPHEALNPANEEKQKDDFLSEMAQDEQKMAQMAQIAKEFDERLKKIETAFSGLCSTSPHEEGTGLNMPMGEGAKPAAGQGTVGMPLHSENPVGPASPSVTSPSGVVQKNAFNPPSAPIPQK